MDSIDSKLDLFQSLKNEESSDHLNEQEGTSRKSFSESEDLKFENRENSDDDNGNEPGSSYDKEIKKKVEKQNRKEIEEEEREKML